MFPTTVALLASALLLHATEAACPDQRPTKQLLCYVEQISAQFDPCLCTHLVLQAPLDKLSPQSELLKTAKALQEKNPALRLVAVASDMAEVALKRRDTYAKTVSNVVDKCKLDGVELDLHWGAKVAGKVQLVDLVQSISKEFKSLEPNVRTKRDYKIYEQSNDDVTTPQWTPPNSKARPRKTRSSEEETRKETKVEEKEDVTEEKEHRAIFLRLAPEPQHLAKNFDLKRLSKYVDLYTIASDNLTDASEHGLAYHPSRLMGIQDILNADSLIDLLTGLGAPHDKLILSLPARALKFTLKDPKKNLPQSPVTGAPQYISQSELCAVMSEGNWTVERDEDLTAPYAFHDTTWIAFDDAISTSIKGKYVLLRDLAGGAVMAADAEDWAGKCNASKPAVLATLYDTFTNVARKSRAAQLISLQEELHESAQYSYSGDIHLSPYRIVRVVDRAGAIHVVRKEAKTEFECSRQGYFTHPSGCNRFYRCVKFNQYTPDFTVFEYDCPAGLAFDERYEVCVWPGSLPDGGACQGSSEIAPVPRGRYVCPRVEGYYADPENCRWFFACLDHVRDGATPLTAYEFRCPFGLVFNEKALVCDWPWLVEGCGGVGAFRASFSVGDFYEGRHRASYASLSDVHVSGGRIENAPGAGVVLGSSVIGGLASGSNVHSAGAGLYGGAYSAKGYSGGAYDYSALNGAYGGRGSGSEGGLYVAGGHSSGAGLYSGSDHSGGAGGLYVAGGHSNDAGLYSGSDHSGGAGAYVAGGSGGSKYYAAGGAKLNGYASGQYGGAGVYGGSSGYSAGSTYTSGGAGYKDGVSDTSAYVEGGAYEAGKYAGSNVGLGYSGGVVYTGADDSGKYDGQYSGVGKGAYSSSSIVSQSGGAAYVPAYKLSGGYDAGQVSYHGGFGQKSLLKTPSVPVTLVSDAISSGYNHDLSGFNLVSEHKPVSFVNVESVKVTPGSDAISGIDVHHLTPLVTPSPAPAVSVSTYSTPVIKAVTQSPISISSYQPPVVYQPSSPRPTTYYVSPSLSVTPAPITYQRPLVPAVTPAPITYQRPLVPAIPPAPITYQRPLVPAVTPEPITYQRPLVPAIPPAPITYQRPLVPAVTPSPLPAVHISTYQQPLVKTVTPSPISFSQVSRIPTVLKTPVVPLNPVQYSTPAPFSVGYSTPAPVAPLQPVHISTPAPLPAVSSVRFSYPKPAIGVVKTPVVPYNPVSYTFKQPLAPIQLSTPAPTFIKTVTQAPVVYQEEYTYQNPLQPALQPVLPVQPVQYPQPQPAVSYTYSYNKASEIKSPVAVTPSSLAVDYSPSPATVVQPLEVKYSYPKPVVINTPVVALNPIQYSTPAPIEHPATFVKPLDVKYSYPRPAVLKTPVIPLNPVQYSTPAPIAYAPTTFVKPLEVKYSYPRPAVIKPPVVPLNPVQYSTIAPSPAPINFQYSAPAHSYSQSEYIVEKNLPAPVSLVKEIPRPAFRAPIQYSTPAPIAFEYPSPKPISFRPTVLKTPIVPLNPVQYSTPAPAYFEHSTPAPVPYLPPLSPISSVKFGTGYKAPLTVTEQAYSVDYSYQQPIKSPVTPVAVEYSSVTPAPIQQVEVNYNYPKPVKYVPPVLVSSTPAVVHQTVTPTIPMYQRVINAFKAPVVTAYQKVLDVISSSPPSTLVQPVTQSPISYAPVDVGYSYKKPALVKTPSIPVTPVNVVPAYQKVLNVVKASTTPATLYANHYTSTYETPRVVVTTPKPAVISESSFGLDFSNHGFEGNTDEFYDTVRQDFGKIGAESYKQEFSGYEYNKPAVKFTEGVSFVQENIPLKQDVNVYSQTTQAPVIKQTYRKPVKTFVEYEQPAYNVEFESGKLSGYKQVAKTPFVEQYGGHVGVEYDGSVGYSQLPVVTSTSTAVPIVKQDYGHVGVEYDGSIGYAQVPVTLSTPAPTVEITTARVSLPVVKVRPVDAYRRKQSRLRPLVVTETYPTSTLKSTFTPTVFTPTYYTSPATYSTTAAYEGEELEVEGEEDGDKLLEAYNGQFGGVLTKGVSVSGYAGESSTVANIKDGEAIVGVLKKGRVDYTGRKTKSKVVVVSRLSDFNPILVGKLGAECSCSPKSNTVSLRRRGKTQQLFTPTDYLQPLPGQTLTDTYVTSTSTVSPDVSGYEEYGASFYSEKQLDGSPIVEIKPLVDKTVLSTTVIPLVDTAPLTYQAPVKLSKTIKTYSENSLRPTYQDVLQKSVVFADAGKSFDRYGPGGLRGVDETLQGSVDCKRAGLFRHPKYCNKFYACNWDQWKGRFTLHVFNCPVHLAYDSGLGACNWPSKGPACADDNLLV